MWRVVGRVAVRVNRIQLPEHQISILLTMLSVSVRARPLRLESVPLVVKVLRLALHLLEVRAISPC